MTRMHNSILSCETVQHVITTEETCPRSNEDFAFLDVNYTEHPYTLDKPTPTFPLVRQVMYTQLPYNQGEPKSAAPLLRTRHNRQQPFKEMKLATEQPCNQDKSTPRRPYIEDEEISNSQPGADWMTRDFSNVHEGLSRDVSNVYEGLSRDVSSVHEGLSRFATKEPGGGSRVCNIRPEPSRDLSTRPPGMLHDTSRLRAGGMGLEKGTHKFWLKGTVIAMGNMRTWESGFRKREFVLRSESATEYPQDINMEVCVFFCHFLQRFVSQRLRQGVP